MWTSYLDMHMCVCILMHEWIHMQVHIPEHRQAIITKLKIF